MKKSRLNLLCFCVVFIFTICTSCNGTSKEKDFSKAGATITLNENFTEKKVETATAYFESNNAVVTFFKEDFTLFEDRGVPADFTLKEYAELILTANLIEAEIESGGDLTSFVYEKQDSSEIEYTHYATVFESEDAYWLVQFVCEKKDFEKLKPQFEHWAKSVRFTLDMDSFDSSVI